MLPGFLPLLCLPPGLVGRLSCGSWPSLLSWSPASDGLTAVPVGASKPYSRRASTPCSFLAPLVPAVCLGGVPALLVSSKVPRCGRSGAAILGPTIFSPLLTPAPCASVDWLAGGVPYPHCPRPPSPSTLLPVVGTLGVPYPRGNASNPGVLMPCGNSTPPPNPWRSPLGFFATPEAS